MQWTENVARIKDDERMIVKIGKEEWEIKKVKYLTPKMQRSPWRIDGKTFFSKNDAESALVIYKVKWKDIVKQPEPIVEKQVSSWFELQ